MDQAAWLQQRDMQGEVAGPCALVTTPRADCSSTLVNSPAAGPSNRLRRGMGGGPIRAQIPSTFPVHSFFLTPPNTSTQSSSDIPARQRCATFLRGSRLILRFDASCASPAFDPVAASCLVDAPPLLPLFYQGNSRIDQSRVFFDHKQRFSAYPFYGRARCWPMLGAFTT